MRLLCESIARGGRCLDDIAAAPLRRRARARERRGARRQPTSNGVVDGADVSASRGLHARVHARTRAVAPGEDRADAPDGLQTHRSASGDARAAHHRAEGKCERPKSARLARGGRPRSDVVAAGGGAEAVAGGPHRRACEGRRWHGGEGPRTTTGTTRERVLASPPSHAASPCPRARAAVGRTRGQRRAVPRPRGATGKGERGTHDANAKQAHAADAQMAGSEATFGTATKARKPPVPKINMKRVKSKGGKPGQLAGVVKGEEDGARDARGTDRNTTRADERRGARAGADAPSPAVESTLGGETAIDAADGNDAAQQPKRSRRRGMPLGQRARRHRAGLRPRPAQRGTRAYTRHAWRTRRRLRLPLVRGRARMLSTTRRSRNGRCCWRACWPCARAPTRPATSKRLVLRWRPSVVAASSRARPSLFSLEITSWSATARRRCRGRSGTTGGRPSRPASGWALSSRSR